jgi:hypothetical protein
LIEFGLVTSHAMRCRSVTIFFMCSVREGNSSLSFRRLE